MKRLSENPLRILPLSIPGKWDNPDVLHLKINLQSCFCHNRSGSHYAKLYS